MKKLKRKIKGKYNKRKCISEVLNSPQFNNDVVNLHRYDVNNVGDMYCAPHHYFEELKGKYLDIFDYKSKDSDVRNKWVEKVSNNSLIIGGGGLLNYHGFEKQMKLFEKLGEIGKKNCCVGSWT